MLQGKMPLPVEAAVCIIYHFDFSPLLSFPAPLQLNSIKHGRSYLIVEAHTHTGVSPESGIRHWNMIKSFYNRGLSSPSLTSNGFSCCRIKTSKSKAARMQQQHELYLYLCYITVSFSIFLNLYFPFDVHSVISSSLSLPHSIKSSNLQPHPPPSLIPFFFPLFLDTVPIQMSSGALPEQERIANIAVKLTLLPWCFHYEQMSSCGETGSPSLLLVISLVPFKFESTTALHSSPQLRIIFILSNKGKSWCFVSF